MRMQKNTINPWIHKMLSWILANTYVLFTKVRNYHVNYIWPDFLEVHEELWNIKDKLYTEIDRISEQIRMCWWISPFSLDEFKSMSVIKESPWKLVSLTEVMNDLHNDFCTLDMWICKAIELLSTDYATQNTLIDIKWCHDKLKWFIRSTLWQV